MELGLKYLEDADYEEAVAEFSAAIDIEQNMQAYRLSVWTDSDQGAQEVYNASILGTTSENNDAESMMISFAETGGNRYLLKETVCRNQRVCDVLEWQNGRLITTELLRYYWSDKAGNWIFEKNGERLSHSEWHQSYDECVSGWSP